MFRLCSFSSPKFSWITPRSKGCGRQPSIESTLVRTALVPERAVEAVVRPWVRARLWSREWAASLSLSLATGSLTPSRWRPVARGNSDTQVCIASSDSWLFTVYTPSGSRACSVLATTSWQQNLERTVWRVERSRGSSIPDP